MAIIVVLIRLSIARADHCATEYAPGKFDFRESSYKSSVLPTNRGIMPKGFVALSDGTPVVHGIDVSKWQGSVDFIKIASCGGRFAYIRLSAGQNPDNELEYRALWNNARYANLHVGPYHNLTFINLNKPVKNLSKREKDDLLKTNLDAAKKQAQLFSSRLIEVLSLDPQLQGNSNKLGLPYLPIALDASLRPGGEGDDAERNLVGEIYAESICTWINEVTREQTFAGQPIVLFTMPFIYNDFNLSRGSCGLDKIPIWISHRTLDGDREFAEKDTDNLAVIRLLCGPSKEESRCIIHQYTSFGNFALHQRSEGLDMNRFYGSEDDLWRWLQQATLY